MIWKSLQREKHKAKRKKTQNKARGITERGKMTEEAEKQERVNDEKKNKSLECIQQDLILKVDNFTKFQKCLF